jgi:hypothetical protein
MNDRIETKLEVSKASPDRSYRRDSYFMGDPRKDKKAKPRKEQARTETRIECVSAAALTTGFCDCISNKPAVSSFLTVVIKQPHNNNKSPFRYQKLKSKGQQARLPRNKAAKLNQLY